MYRTFVVFAMALMTQAPAASAQQAVQKEMMAVVTGLSTAKHTCVPGDRAYLVIPASYEITQNGKQVKQIGSTLTAALQKGATGWRIIAWTWSTN